MKTSEPIRHGYIALELDPASRALLAVEFPPQFSKFIGHHVTYMFGIKSSVPLPTINSVSVIGYACNEEGLEALVCEVNGSTKRTDGKIFHITWSLEPDEGFKPVQSNKLIEAGYQPVKPINITATAKFYAR
jgi:hypothetical protein